MRTLWSRGRRELRRGVQRFDAIRVNPKPVRDGESRRRRRKQRCRLRRAAALGDGWYGFNLTVAEAVERASALAAYWA